MNNFLSKFKLNKKISHKNEILNPHKYWSLVIRIFFVVAFVVLAFSFYISYRIKTESIFKTEYIISTPPSLLKEQSLKSVDKFFEEKKIKFENYKQNSKFVDPSF